jgi:hypothetical protein
VARSSLTSLTLQLATRAASNVTASTAPEGASEPPRNCMAAAMRRLPGCAGCLGHNADSGVENPAQGSIRGRVAKITNAHVTRVQEAVLVITGLTAAPAQGSALHGGSTQNQDLSPGGGPMLGASLFSSPAGCVVWLRRSAPSSADGMVFDALSASHVSPIDPSDLLRGAIVARDCAPQGGVAQGIKFARSCALPRIACKERPFSHSVGSLGDPSWKERRAVFEL